MFFMHLCKQSQAGGCVDYRQGCMYVQCILPDDEHTMLERCKILEELNYKFIFNIKIG
jgi:hypothetical protein